MNDKKFVGRKREIEEFKEFLIGERSSWGGGGKGAPLLLVVGDRGIGKRSLLQEMAKQANDQNHYVFPRDVYKGKSFENQIYDLIAMVERGERFNWGTIDDWFRIGVATLSLFHGGIANILSVAREISKEHEERGHKAEYLEDKLHSALTKLDGKIKGDQKIVVLLYPKPLYSEMGQSPVGLIWLLEYMSKNEVPPKVRFVIAQRPKDAIIKTADKGEPKELREICAEPMEVSMMDTKDSLDFIEVYDTQRRLNDAMRKVFLEIYGGWPLAMELGLQQIPETGEITEEIIRRLPKDVRTIWEDRYNKVKDREARNFVQTVCLLLHPYRNKDLALFTKLGHDAVEDVSRSGSPVWRLLKKEEYTDPLLKEPKWENCPSPIHATTKEHVVELLKTEHEDLYRMRHNAIISNYQDKVGDDFEKADEEKDAFAYLFPQMLEAQFWDEIDKLFTNISYLKKRQEPEEQYNFQSDFIDLLNNEKIPDDKLVNILEGVLKAIREQLPTSNEKADWLDTFAYWINAFGVKGDTERSSALKNVARKFDRACGDVSRELAEDNLNKGENDWALRFAELRTWVYQRAGDYDKCADACRDAEKMCKGMEDAYRYLGQAEFIRLRAHALTKLSKIATDESKKTEYKAKAHEAYEELNKVFPAEGGESQWPRIKEWEELEELLEKNTDKVLPPPSQARSDKPRAFRAKVVSNLPDCISAMHIIQFFEKHDGLVEWIHHEEFEPEQFAPKDTTFTVLLGGPKAPGISKVAYEFFETDKERFLRMYSGRYFEAHCLKITKGKTHCYMLGGISKVNTLKAAYDFTKDDEVMQIIRKGQSISS